MLGERKLPRVQETFSCKTTFYEMYPSPENFKNQEINSIKSKKLTELSNYVH